MVYTHEAAHDRLAAIANTWARHCDGFFAASTQTNHSIGATYIPHLGPEHYNNMWQKVRSMWGYVYEHKNQLLHNYDYFHICGDDVYVVVENLKAYILSDEVQRLENNGYLDSLALAHPKGREAAQLRPRPLMLGMPVDKGRYKFPLGGPGYTLNRAAVELFGTQGLHSFLPNLTDPREDVLMGGFFDAHGVTTADTRDDAHGSWRYGEDVERHATLSGKEGFWEPQRMTQKYKNLTYWDGIDFLSEQTIAFHLKLSKSAAGQIPELIYRYHEILYRDDDECQTSTS